MSRRAFSDVAALLNDLLDRFEANPNATRLFAYVDEEGIASVRDRDRFEHELDAAAASGGIHVERRRVDGDLLIAHVRLTDPPLLYTRLFRQPSGERSNAAIASVRARDDLPDGALSLLDEIAEA